MAQAARRIQFSLACILLAISFFSGLWVVLNDEKKESLEEDNQTEKENNELIKNEVEVPQQDQLVLEDSKQIDIELTIEKSSFEYEGSIDEIEETNNESKDSEIETIGYDKFGKILSPKYRIRVKGRFEDLFKGLGQNEQGYEEFEHLQSGIIFVHLPGGEFLMGSPPKEKGHLWHEYQHKVTISPFLIAKYEVSVGHWEAVMGKQARGTVIKGANLPVTDVSWEKCFGAEDSFCQKLGLQLPTEAQWEYACRAGTTTPFFFGEDLTEDQVNFNNRYPYKVESPVIYPKRGWKSNIPVHTLLPNGFGLHHMHGNVFEWCEDVYNNNYYRSEAAKNGDLAHFEENGSRIIRGGSWRSAAALCRSASRDWYSSKDESSDIGFRPVWVFPDSN